jgi:hypothetical protein
MARGDWTVYGFVRAGIEARARLERVQEEKSQLRLHAQRLIHWVCRRLAVLLQALDEPDSRSFAFNINTIIIHHYRVIKSLLKADAPLFGPEERSRLITMQRRIVEKLDLENIEITGIAAEGRGVVGVGLDEAGIGFDAENLPDAINRVDRDDDADSVWSNEDGLNRELHEEEVGGYIADRLREDVDEELVDRYIADRIMEDVDEELGIFDGDGDEELGMFDGDGDEDADGMDLDL